MQSYDLLDELDSEDKFRKDIKYSRQLPVFAVAGIMIKFHDSCKNPDIVQGPPGLLHHFAGR